MVADPHVTQLPNDRFLSMPVFPLVRALLGTSSLGCGAKIERKKKAEKVLLKQLYLKWKEMLQSN